MDITVQLSPRRLRSDYGKKTYWNAMVQVNCEEVECWLKPAEARRLAVMLLQTAEECDRAPVE